MTKKIHAISDHTFANGEDGAKLAKVFISNIDIAPTGMGDAAIRICNNVVHKVPGKNEAELFSEQNGIQTENAGDTGGGLNVGWIDTNDWMEYTIDVATDTVLYRYFSLCFPWFRWGCFNKTRWCSNW